MPTGSRWTVRLAAAAEHDFHQIIRWTHQQFGEAQARAYALTLSTALQALTAGPDLVGIRQRDELRKGVLALHISRLGRKGRHFLIFRVRSPHIDVLRILHDSMDFPRHLP